MRGCALVGDLLLQQFRYFCGHWGGPASSGTHCGLDVSVCNSAWLGNCPGFSGIDPQQQLKSPREDRKAAGSCKCCLARKTIGTERVESGAALSQAISCALHAIAHLLCAAPAGPAGEITSQKHRKDFPDYAERLLGDVTVFLWHEVCCYCDCQGFRIEKPQGF